MHGLSHSHLLLQMLRAVRECPNPIQMGRLRELVDPNLMDMFPQDCLYKVDKERLPFF